MSFDLDKPYCYNIPTKFRPELGKIFVAGATGYIGGRRVFELKQRGYDVKALVRAELPKDDIRFEGVEVVVVEVVDDESLKESMKDVKIAFYLMHSLLIGKKELEASEIKAALNFRRAAEANRSPVISAQAARTPAEAQHWVPRMGRHNSVPTRAQPS